MKKIAVLIGITWLVTTTAGCMMRYSQSITGSIHKVQTYKIANSGTGTDVGLEAFPYGITFREPKGAAELANYPCDVEMLQVDYRSKWYAYYIRVDSPAVEVTTYCIGNK